MITRWYLLLSKSGLNINGSGISQSPPPVVIILVADHLIYGALIDGFFMMDIG
jgi:hypothetical protein